MDLLDECIEHLLSAIALDLITLWQTAVAGRRKFTDVITVGKSSDSTIRNT
jgi:hypothetical protein